jgi:hypothetical protein
MKKAQCEKAIRNLCHKWAEDRGIHSPPSDQPSYSDFKSWVRENGFSRFLEFRSVAGADYDAEMWFDQEFEQTWRN